MLDPTTTTPAAVILSKDEFISLIRRTVSDLSFHVDPAVPDPLPHTRDDMHRQTLPLCCRTGSRGGMTYTHNVYVDLLPPSPQANGEGVFPFSSSSTSSRSEEDTPLCQHLRYPNGSVSCARLQQFVKTHYPDSYRHYVEENQRYKGKWHHFVREAVGLHCGHYVDSTTASSSSPSSGLSREGKNNERESLPDFTSYFLQPAHIAPSELRCFLPRDSDYEEDVKQNNHHDKQQEDEGRATKERRVSPLAMKNVFRSDFYLGCLLYKYVRDDTLWEEVCSVIETHVQTEVRRLFLLQQHHSNEGYYPNSNYYNGYYKPLLSPDHPNDSAPLPSYIMYVYRLFLLYSPDRPYYSHRGSTSGSTSYYPAINLPRLANDVLHLLTLHNPLVQHLSRGTLRYNIVRLLQKDQAFITYNQRLNRSRG